MDGLVAWTRPQENRENIYHAKLIMYEGRMSQGRQWLHTLVQHTANVIDTTTTIELLWPYVCCLRVLRLEL